MFVCILVKLLQIMISKHITMPLLPNPKPKDEPSPKKLERQNPLLTEFVLKTIPIVPNPIVKSSGVMAFQISF